MIPAETGGPEPALVQHPHRRPEQPLLERPGLSSYKPGLSSRSGRNRRLVTECHPLKSLTSLRGSEPRNFLVVNFHERGAISDIFKLSVDLANINRLLSKFFQSELKIPFQFKGVSTTAKSKQLESKESAV